MLRHAALILIASGLVTPVAAQSHLVLSGEPTSKVEAGPISADRTTLSTTDRTRFGITITESHGEFYWASRENRPLVHLTSGIYHIFIDPTGGGYIKVLDQRGLGPDYPFSGPPVQYLEFLTLGLLTITYWGTVQTLSLD